MSPGSVPTNATEIYQEGIRIPPLKYRDAGEVNQTLVDLLTLNVRVPETFMGDLNAQVAACSIGARRMGELAERYGSNHLPAIAEELLGRSERLARRAIERIPDGRYHYVDWLDNDGVDLDQPVRIEVAVEIARDRVLIDFEGDEPTGAGAVQLRSVGRTCRRLFRGDRHDGFVDSHQRRLLQADRAPPPAREHRESTRARAGQLAHLDHQAHRRVDHRRTAPGAARGSAGRRRGPPCMSSRSAVRARTARDTWSGSSSRPGAERAGARTEWTSSKTDGSNCMNLPVEALEMDVPIRMRRSELRPDSGGRGEFRGGLGISREYEVLAGEVVFTHRGERHRRPAQGAAGGGPGACAHSVIRRAGGAEEIIPSKMLVSAPVRRPRGGQYGRRRRIRRPRRPGCRSARGRCRGRQDQRGVLGRDHGDGGWR